MRWFCAAGLLALGTAAVSANPAGASLLPPQIHTVAGGGSCSGLMTSGGICDGIKATSVSIAGARFVSAIPGGGFLYIDSANDLVREVSASGIVTTVAGTSVSSPTLTNPNAVAPDTIDEDNVPATQSGLDNPVSVAALPDGGFLITEFAGCRVRMVSPGPPGVATITTIAGIPPDPTDPDGTPQCTSGSYPLIASGPATQVSLSYPSDAEPTADGGVLIADTYNHRILLLTSYADPSATIATIAGGGSCDDATTFCDGLPASGVQLGLVNSVSELQDGSGGYLFTESDAGGIREDSVREVSQEAPTGTFSTVAGEPGSPGYSGDGGPATFAQLTDPGQVVSLAGGGFLIADTGNEVIREVSPSGTISTIAGNGQASSGGDGGAATAASLDAPAAAAPLANGNILIADQENGLIREITIPSVSSFKLSPSSPNGTNGWYISDPTLSVTATQKASIQCELDPVQAPPAYGAIQPGCPLTGSGSTITTNGVHTAYAASQNSFGDQENPVSLSIKVDTASPTITCNGDPEFPFGDLTATVTATLSDSISGPQSEPLSAPVPATDLGAQTAALGGTNDAGTPGARQCPYSVTPVTLSPSPTAKWSFRTTAESTTVSRLMIRDIPAGATLEVTCAGRGCPFKGGRTVRTGSCTICKHAPAGVQMADLAPLFRRAQLAPGATVAAIIVEYGAIGKYITFVIRAGKLAVYRSQCLAPGATKPGGSCTAVSSAGASGSK